MASNATFIPSKKSQEAVIEYYRQTQNIVNRTRNTSRNRYTAIDKSYQREVDQTEAQARAKAANKQGDVARMQNVVVPVVMPQVESAVVYQTSVFLTGDPLFGVVSAPEFIDEALQLETAIENHSIKGGWTRHLLMSFRDGFKYNFAPMEITWSRAVTFGVETDPDFSEEEGKTKEVIWTGNELKRLDPYNTFVDTKVHPSLVSSQGEFAGYTDFISRIELKRRIAELLDHIISNVTPAFESGGESTRASDSTNMGYFVPPINPEVDENALVYGETNWLKWASLADSEGNIDYRDNYDYTTFYARILPSDFAFNVPKSNTPQIWKFIIVNHSVLLLAERQTNAHNLIPILVAQPHEDGLGYQTKSLGKNAEPFQQLATSYMTSIIESRRRAISDRTLFDPSRITAAHINSANPSAKIPVKPSAFGKTVSDAVYAFPYREDQAANSMSQIGALLTMADKLNGQNPARQGQFVKGNKTQNEFDSVMANANGRDQMTSILLEAQMFTPLKNIIKINILQFQGGTTIYNRNKDVTVEIDPVKLRRAVLEFRVTDGLIPADKVISADSFGIAIQQMSNPQIGQEYNLGQAFSYLMKTQGADLTPFEKSREQVAYEQALAAWQGAVVEALKAGVEADKLPPQPKPEEFGFNPQQQKPAPNQQGKTPIEGDFATVEN